MTDVNRFYALGKTEKKKVDFLVVNYFMELSGWQKPSDNSPLAACTMHKKTISTRNRCQQ